MIKKFRFGNPYHTDAVVCDIDESTGDFPYFYLLEEEIPTFLYRMGKEDKVYGLGEQIRGINKRGWIYDNFCMDDPNHTEGKTSLYGAHNFIIIDGVYTFGIFIDCPSQVTFDLGYSNSEQVLIKVHSMDFDWYLIEGRSKLEIVRSFRTLIGTSYIPPKWAFGYQQSRWSYMNANEVKEVVAGHRKHGIPLDAVYLDIDYMEGYKNFTIDQKRFPRFASFVEDMRKQGIRLVPIIDAGVKIEEGYDIYEEGMANGYFCIDETGKEFTAGVWPGKVHFPDMLNENARAWFGYQYSKLLELGIEGFWNDMNEPAIFYSENHLTEVLQELDHYKNENLDLEKVFSLRELVNGLANNHEDYMGFYHLFQGEHVRHDVVHNLYGFYMTKAAGEAFDALVPSKRILLFSRSSSIGMHRYGGIWTGDNQSWWSHLLLAIKMLPSLNMCGFLYVGADIGGFGGNATEDLLLRWIQYSIFVPLMRNHSALGTRRQEVYLFERVTTFKEMIRIRYGLIPYLYSEFVKAALNNGMFAKPLSFVFTNDSHVNEVEDQLMIGDSLMIAPIYTQNATGRYVYLPEPMLMIRMKSLEQRECVVIGAGHRYITCGLDEVVFFVRKNHLLLLADAAETVEEIKANRFKVLGYLDETAHYELYQDDGFTKDYENPDHYFSINVRKDGSYEVKGSDKIQLYTTIYRN